MLELRNDEANKNYFDSDISIASRHLIPIGKACFKSVRTWEKDLIRVRFTNRFNSDNHIVGDAHWPEC